MQKRYRRLQRDPFLDSLEFQIKSKRNAPLLTKNQAGQELVVFKVNKNTKKFFPAILPKKGELVVLESGPQNQNIVVSEEWKIEKPITLYSVLIIIEEGIEYSFQVLPSTRSGMGEFNPLKQRTLERNYERKGRSGGTVGHQKG